MARVVVRAVKARRRSRRFSGFYAPSSYLIVLLEVFAIGLFACAVAAEYVGTIFERLNAHTLWRATEAERAQELWIRPDRAAAAAGPADRSGYPAMSSPAASLRRNFLGRWRVLARRPQICSTSLRFSYPDIVQELIAGPDGGSAADRHPGRGPASADQVRVLHVAHKGHRLALLTIEDATEVFCLKAALDTVRISPRWWSMRAGTSAGVQQACQMAVRRRGSRRRMRRSCSLNRRQPALVGSGLTGRRKMHIEIASADLPGHELRSHLGRRGGAYFHRVVPPGRQRRHGRSALKRARRC